jgi:hypothetical protein
MEPVGNVGDSYCGLPTGERGMNPLSRSPMRDSGRRAGEMGLTPSAVGAQGNSVDSPASN